MWYWHKDRHIDQWIWFESPEINSYIYVQLILNKDAKTIQWDFQQLMQGQTGYTQTKE